MEQENLLYCYSCGNIFKKNDGEEAAKQWNYDYGPLICPDCTTDESMLESLEEIRKRESETNGRT